mmetsp:Transcript_31488/g.60841  ORF Transcript_31488/g.60841 Transcript_31488/m.60841 type:complete len:106 (+) Transcript_31488:1266-1583(+)
MWLPSKADGMYCMSNYVFVPTVTHEHMLSTAARRRCMHSVCTANERQYFRWQKANIFVGLVECFTSRGLFLGHQWQLRLKLSGTICGALDLPIDATQGLSWVKQS